MIERVIDKLNEANSIAIFMHARPDGDTFGSSLALFHALKSMGKNAFLFCEDGMSQNFSYLKGFDQLNSSEFASYELLIAVDCADDGRLGKFKDIFLGHENTINIDHHISNTQYAKINLVDMDAAATAMVMYEVISAMIGHVSADIAECLYTGISTDTGNFAHANTTAKTMAVATKLIECGVEVSKITNSVYKSSSLERTKLLSIALSKMEFYLGSSVAVITINMADLAKSGAKKSDTEGFIDYAIGIRGVDVGICMFEHAADSYKVSFRAKSANVLALAAEFGGGGHKLASGCQINGMQYDVIEKLINTIKRLDII